jgi:hypothetical protein
VEVPEPESHRRKDIGRKARRERRRAAAKSGGAGDFRQEDNENGLNTNLLTDMREMFQGPLLGTSAPRVLDRIC